APARRDRGGCAARLRTPDQEQSTPVQRGVGAGRGGVEPYDTWAGGRGVGAEAIGDCERRRIAVRAVRGAPDPGRRRRGAQTESPDRRPRSYIFTFGVRAGDDAA